MAKIEIELDSPSGPKVVYPKRADADDVEAAVPYGWEVDWETTPADVLGGRKASPLKRLPHRPTRSTAPASERIVLRVTPDERARWQAAAERAGKTLSEWIRERCA